jgi:hypothetical protein
MRKVSLPYNLVSSPTPLHTQRLQLVLQTGSPFHGVTPSRPHPVSPQQAVLVLRQKGQRHEEDPLLAPAGFRGDGEHLRG